MIKKYFCVVRVFLSKILLGIWQFIQNFFIFLLAGSMAIIAMVGCGIIGQWIVKLIWGSLISIPDGIIIVMFPIGFIITLIMLCVSIYKKWKESKEECWDLFQENK
jgi:hypothetical protein